MREFLLREDSMQHRFLRSKAKVQIVGGGFGNGKTTAAVQKALRLSQLYPGSNGLMARATFPKLNDTLRKEFLKWCPASWIKSFPMSANASNTCTLKNGTTINFRYIAQQGKTNEASTSNLLSATYDWIVVDQMEDPEIVEKDFLDLLGRLRGSTPFVGRRVEDDPMLGDMNLMPETGPRWFMIMCNPTRNWFYQRLVKPLHTYTQTGEITKDLLCVREDKTGLPQLDVHGKPIMMLELFEGSTYENAHVLEPDFIKTLESTYQGQMRDRFLLGKWASYEGLVYPMYDDTMHLVTQQMMSDYLDSLTAQGIKPEWIEAYDFGIAAPSCYLLAFVDHLGNVLVCDGFYEKEMQLDEQVRQIEQKRRAWGADSMRSFADPAIFNRVASKNVGTSVNGMFEERGIHWMRGNNNIVNGVFKVQGHLSPRAAHRHPITGTYPAPYLYFAHELTFISDEINGYYWGTDTNGIREDKPIGVNDHCMDCLRYLLSMHPDAAQIDLKNVTPPAYMSWHERDVMEQTKRARYGNR